MESQTISSSSSSRPGRFPRPRPETVLAFALVFVLAVILYTRHNGFPTFYYTDEKLKVQYILKGTTAFNHPLLLMGSGRQAVKLVGIREKKKNLQQVYIVGRTVSAIYAALAVLALMGIAAQFRGAAGAWSVGLVTALSPLLLTLAHYLKEDTALLFGLALTFLALTRLLRRPDVAGQFLLGAAVGITLSGKYIGAIVLPFALVALMQAGPPVAAGRWKRLGRFLLALVLVVVIINSRAITHLHEFSAAFAAESGKVASGRNGLQANTMALTLLAALGRTVAWPVLGLAAAYVGIFAVTWRRRTAAEWHLVLFPLVYFVGLCFSRVLFVRYALPVVAWMHLWAGLAILELPAFLPAPARLRWGLTAALLALTVGVQGARCANVLGQFADDSRERLARWAAANLPPQAHVLEDMYARLAAFKDNKPLQDKLRFRVESPKWAADYAPFGELRQKGITHVAVCSMAFHRYLTTEKKAAPGAEREVEKYRTFYERLFKEGELVWSAVAPDPVGHHTNPWLYLFKLRETPPQKENSALWEELKSKIDLIQE